jgi:hypothetical protein
MRLDRIHWTWPVPLGVILLVIILLANGLAILLQAIHLPLFGGVPSLPVYPLRGGPGITGMANAVTDIGLLNYLLAGGHFVIAAGLWRLQPWAWRYLVAVMVPALLIGFYQALTANHPLGEMPLVALYGLFTRLLWPIVVLLYLTLRRTRQVFGI